MLFIESLKKFASREIARYKTFQIEKLNVLKFFRNFAQIFFEILLNNLNTHDQIEHSINFVKEKMSRINCVYNISQNEFVAFRNYIINVLKKN